MLCVKGLLAFFVIDTFHVDLASLTGYMAITELLKERIPGIFSIVTIDCLQTARIFFISTSH